MEINIERASTYMAVRVTGGDAVIYSGLLDEHESIELAQELIFAAESLLPAECGQEEFQLSQVRDSLSARCRGNHD